MKRINCINLIYLMLHKLMGSASGKFGSSSGRVGILGLALVLLMSSGAFAQTTVSGVVKDSETGDALPGVTVMVKGTTYGVITDLDGNYRINAKPDDVLMFSFVGFKNQEMTVGTQTSITVTMETDVKQLNEVVVTALGIEREEKSLGYAVATVDSKQMTEAGATSIGASLYGKLSGVRVTGGIGGASSAINIQIRGASSMTGNTQPLYVVDGIPMRNNALINTSNAGSNDDYWSESRIRENGLLDINPEDIESLTVLKGATASALYGSDGQNGVVVITTKKGNQKQGLGVDVKLQYDVESLMMQPSWQNSYGPGYGTSYNNSIVGNAEGWVQDDDGSVHPYYASYAQFGPKFDGSQVTYWDGSTRAYNAHPNNYKNFFNTGSNFNGSVAISGSTDKATYRMSYTRTDYTGIMPGYDMQKNNFNLNASFQLNKKVRVDLKSTYLNSLTHNRPLMMNQIFGSYTGFFSRFDDMSVIKNKYETSEGYKYVTYNTSGYNDEERLKYSYRATNLLDYFWTQKRDSRNEYSNRIMNSATFNYKITDKLNFRARIGNDYTSTRFDIRQHNTYQSSIGYSGGYAVNRGEYSLLYGDLLATYSETLGSDWKLNVSVGATARKDNYTENDASTNGGLVIENWFNLANSAQNFTTSQISNTLQNSLMEAEFAMLDLSYKDYLFIQGTGRYEGRSTLPAGNNHYFYPSVNASFVFSEAFNMPAFMDYGKLRSSYGVTAAAPDIYQASVTYGISSVTTSNGSVLYQSPASSEYGNDGIKPQRKNEFEVGIETSMFQSKFSVDLAFYTNVTKNQISYGSVPESTGSASQLMNVGNLANTGFEAMFRYTPIRTSNFRWDATLNWGYNYNKLKTLNNLSYYDAVGGSTGLDNGSIFMRAVPGQTMGTIYVHPLNRDSDGNPIVTDGLYTLNTDKLVKKGNVMPWAVGGLTNTFKYKNVSLNVVIDYRLGSRMISLPYLYMKGAGMFKSTMKGRDAAHGGVSYDIVDGENVANDAGEYHDGVVLKGVNSDGSKNTTVVDAGYYYINTYTWGGYGSGAEGEYKYAVLKNSYVKMREVTLTYQFPKQIAGKVGLNNLTFSVVGRNLFYIWKNTPDNWNPEAPVGNTWVSQARDNYVAAPTRSYGVMLRANF